MMWLYSAAHTRLSDVPSNRQAWHRAWLVSGLTALAGLASLGVVAELSGQSWRILISAALLPYVLLMLCVGIAVPVTGHPRLWFLHLCAPPATLTAVLSGIGVVSPTALVLSWSVGLPVLLGMLLSSACAVSVSDRAEAIAREYSRRRTAGPSSELPVLRLQRDARLVRLTAAAGCVVLAIGVVWPLLVRPMAFGFNDAVALALLVGALACLRFEAALLCWLKHPLVAVQGQTARATYAGRWTLFAPTTSLRPLMISEQCAARASVGLMALLREGSVGPAVRRASSRLTLDQAQRLCLSLSLQPGGAGAIRYLSRALPGQIQAVASTYARLADVAASPPDLQRWLPALTEHPGVVTLAETGLAPDLALTLANARDALLRSSYSPTIESAVHGVRRTVAALYGTIGRTPESGLTTNWPDALLARIEAHARLLRAPGIAGADLADLG